MIAISIDGVSVVYDAASDVTIVTMIHGVDVAQQGAPPVVHYYAKELQEGYLFAEAPDSYIIKELDDSYTFTEKKR
jgi:hypothetical protein